MKNSNNLISRLNRKTGENYESLEVFMVVNDGHLDSVYETEDEASERLEQIEESNRAEAKAVAEEFGMDINNEDDDEEKTNAYIEEISIDDDPDLDNTFVTSEDDEITYGELLEAVLKMLQYDDEEDENFNEEDESGYDDDFDTDRYDE